MCRLQASHDVVEVCWRPWASVGHAINTTRHFNFFHHQLLTIPAGHTFVVLQPLYIKSPITKMLLPTKL